MDKISIIPLFSKKDFSDSITVGGVPYNPDYLIQFPVDKDEINIKNCICVYSILDSTNSVFRKYVGAKFLKHLNSKNVGDKVNGFLPQNIYCFTDTYFPLDDFVKEQKFKFFGQE
ncbi:hypothetical protein [Aequorivita antarctica]|uniref:Uncharacterized protein n=1 Tax=Aequorivita antarctica TaxID=153266 RepID=A0A5C6YUC3_9FLAO|nr:hypothetical protein [Aequorivita antarctica]TXD71115.1 hypothetical protein ESU54_17685 [Aequorivita antarctica]SRX76269.1 hypothetical protein AEQU3_03268 [Aequorivita antarctica]